MVCHQSSSENLFWLSAVLFDPGVGTTCVPLQELLQAVIGTRFVQCRYYFWLVNQGGTENHSTRQGNCVSSYIGQNQFLHQPKAVPLLAKSSSSTSKIQYLDQDGGGQDAFFGSDLQLNEALKLIISIADIFVRYHSCLP